MCRRVKLVDGTRKDAGTKQLHQSKTRGLIWICWCWDSEERVKGREQGLHQESNPQGDQSQSWTSGPRQNLMDDLDVLKLPGKKKSNPVFFFSVCGERKAAVTIRVTIHLSVKSFPVCVKCTPIQSRWEQHSVPSWTVRPQETAVFALLCMWASCMFLCLHGLPSPPGQAHTQNLLEKVPAPALWNYTIYYKTILIFLDPFQNKL